MNHFQYLAFYEWNGPSHAKPFADRLTKHEIAEAFRQLQSEIIHRLDDHEAQVEVSVPVDGETEVRLAVRTSTTHEAFIAVLGPALEACHLYAKPL